MSSVLPQLVNRLTSPVRGFSVLLCLALAGLTACGADDVSTTSSDTSQDTDSSASDTDADADSEDEDDHGDEEDDHDDEDDHDEESGSLGAHEHGTAEMTVAWIDGEVAIDLISPTFNVFGFEYEAETDEDIAAEAERTETLSGGNVISINAEAECSETEPVVTEVERDGSHSEITVTWLFTCENPDAISELDASTLFSEFPAFEDIDAQWLSATDQAAGELSPSAPTLSLES